MGDPSAYDYVPSSADNATPAMCPHCGFGHTGSCPRIKAIEYHQNGTVKRVEYHEVKPMPVGQMSDADFERLAASLGAKRSET